MDAVFPNAISSALSKGKLQSTCAGPIGNTPIWSSAATAPVRPVATDRSDRSHQRPGQAPVPRFEYRVKEKKEEQKLVVDPEKLKTDAVVQIGKLKVPIKDASKEPMDIEKSVDVPSQNRSWPMIMRPVAARAQQTSTINLGGALRV